MRAIDADFVQDALTKTITEILSKSQNESTQYVAMGLAIIKTIIDIAPTLDVAPVRHGGGNKIMNLFKEWKTTANILTLRAIFAGIGNTM